MHIKCLAQYLGLISCLINIASSNQQVFIYGISSLTQALCWVLRGMPKKVDCCPFLKDIKPREDSRMVFSPMKLGQGVGG